LQEDTPVARITTRPQDDEEEMIDDDVEMEAEEESEEAAAPAVSDSRRRRMLKRGEAVATDDSSEPAVTRKDRPTPSSRAAEAPRSSNVVVRFVEDIRDYFQDVVSEMRKVTWLSREEVRRLATIVIAVTAVAAAFLGAVSFLFGYLTQLIATADSTLPAGIAAIVLIVVVVLGWLFREQIFGNRFEV
jgi:preprotein translocase SecE subunit